MTETNLAGGLIGGVLIGLASILLLLSSGRIAGISGILGGIYGKWTETDRLWRIIFLLGLISGAGLSAILSDELTVHPQANGLPLIIAGFLVGFGTRVGSGCTSGHGVCGLAMRSPRSFAATFVFMTVAMITVYLIRHVLA